MVFSLFRKKNPPIISKAQGFTLIEVLMALAILALVMVPLLVEKNRAFQTSLHNHYYRQALLLGYQKLVEIQRGEEGEVSGEFENYPGYSWKLTEEDVSLATDQGEVVLKKWILEVEYPTSSQYGKITLIGYGIGTIKDKQ